MEENKTLKKNIQAKHIIIDKLQSMFRNQTHWRVKNLKESNNNNSILLKVIFPRKALVLCDIDETSAVRDERFSRYETRHSALITLQLTTDKIATNLFW